MLEKAAAGKGLTNQVTEPFTQFAGPTEMEGLPEQFAQFAFQLTPEEPLILEPIEGQDALYLFALKRRVPSELEPLEKIKDRVTEDYRRMEGLTLAREAANAFVNAATNAGANFDAIARQQGFQVVDLPPIIQRGNTPIEGLPPLVDAGALRSAVSDLKPGEVSPYVPTREAGFVATVEKVIPPTDEEVKEQLPEFLREYRQRMTAEAYSDWIAKERQLAQLQLNSGERQESEQ
jgi:parvulin-like peptidyl-prolyl isomerase